MFPRPKQNEQKLAISIEKGKALRKAASEGDIKQVNQLLQSEANINEAGESSKKTALHFAVLYGRDSMVKNLASQKELNPHLQDDKGETPLNLCFEAKVDNSTKLKMLGALISISNPLIPNNQGKTPFMKMVTLRESCITPAMAQECKIVIQKMKLFVANHAKKLGQSASINSNGEVFFGSVTNILSNPDALSFSRQLNVNVIDANDPAPVTRLAPH
jgi:ankyrin repeat protein